MRIKNAFVFALNKHHKAALGISAKHRFIEYSHPHAIRLICIVQSVCILRHGGGGNSKHLLLPSFMISGAKIQQKLHIRKKKEQKQWKILKFDTFFIIIAISQHDNFAIFCAKPKIKVQKNI